MEIRGSQIVSQPALRFFVRSPFLSSFRPCKFHQCELSSVLCPVSFSKCFLVLYLHFPVSFSKCILVVRHLFSVSFNLSMHPSVRVSFFSCLGNPSSCTVVLVAFGGLPCCSMAPSNGGRLASSDGGGRPSKTRGLTVKDPLKDTASDNEESDTDRTKTFFYCLFRFSPSSSGPLEPVAP